MPYGALKLNLCPLRVTDTSRGGDANALRGTETSLLRVCKRKKHQCGGDANALRGTETFCRWRSRDSRKQVAETPMPYGALKLLVNPHEHRQR